MRHTILTGLIALASGTFTLTVRSEELSKDWPQWRGPDASGAALASNPPITWSESENIKWKIDVPGVGNSTPIILGDRIYISTAVKTDRVAEVKPAAEVNPATEAQPQAERGESDRGGERGGGTGRGGGRGGPGGRGRGGAAPINYYDFMVIAYDRATGKEVWRSTLTEQLPHEAGHNDNSFASSSPVTDGQKLYMSFGSRGVFCLDLNGKQLWDVNLGKMTTRNQFGEGSSPALHKGTLVVQWDHEGDSFIVALDALTGEEKWRQPRDEQTTWATPLITVYDGHAQVIANGANRVRSYDLDSGELIWECGGQVGNPIPTPVRFEDNVIVMTGFRGNAIYSIPLSAKGDVTDSDTITWHEGDAAPYVPSPLLYKGQLYFVKSNNGVLVSRDAKSGELIIDQTRLPGISSVYASPVAAADHIYLTSRDGATIVLKHGKSLEVIATNKLDDPIDASAAIVKDEIFLRSRSHLYCISN